MRDKNTANEKIAAINKTAAKNAVWALKLFQNFPYLRPMHLRTLHYKALNIDNLSLPDGSPFTNTPQALAFLDDALQSAQLLGLIPYDAFDRSYSNAGNDVKILPSANSKLPWKYILKQKIEKACTSYLRTVTSILMPVHVEIWAENTKAAQLTETLALRYHLNTISSPGEIQLRDIWDFVRRITTVTKPLRILYISDLTDAAGRNIPAERTTRAIMKQYGLDSRIDIKFRRIGLTKRQRKKFNLPLAPEIPACPKPDKSISTGGVCELYSLEAAKPQLVEKLLEKQLKRYLGKGLISHIGCQTDAFMLRLASLLGQMIDKNAEVSETIRNLESSLKCGF